VTEHVMARSGWRVLVKQRMPWVWKPARDGWYAAGKVRRKLSQRFSVARWYIRKTRWGVEWLRNWYIDRQYGGYCGGSIPTRFAALGAKGTSSADYYQLDKLFGTRGVAIRADDVLVDVGCGKGRILNFWLRRGFQNRLFGLELDPEIAAFAATRLRNFRNVNVVAGNALGNLPDDATFLFLFNPFEAPLMDLFQEQVRRQFRGREGRLRILYVHPKSAHVFREDHGWHLEELHLGTFYRAVLITRKAGASK
jgi:SAM-dependent methyltransferase